MLERGTTSFGGMTAMVATKATIRKYFNCEVMANCKIYIKDYKCDKYKAPKNQFC